MHEGWQEFLLSEIAELDSRKPDSFTGVRYYVDTGSVSGRSLSNELAAVTYSNRPSRANEDRSAGDVGFSKMKLSDKTVLVTPETAQHLFSTGFQFLRPKPNVVPEFLFLVCSSSQFRQDRDALTGDGIMGSVSRRNASSIKIFLPPRSEQARIVNVIESIDSYIDSLQTQVEATRAARSALLAELLSNPGNDWQVTTLGDVADYQNGFPFKPEHLAGSVLPVIRIRQLLDEAEAPDRTDIAVSERHRINDGDIIFSWSATLAVRIWNRGPAVLNQHLFKVLAKPQVEPAWLASALDDAIRDLTGKTHGTTMKHITKRALSAHVISLPPRKEQLRIADLVGSFDKQIASLDSQIDSAQSFRAGVLSELLSGERLLDASYDVAVSL